MRTLYLTIYDKGLSYSTLHTGLLFMSCLNETKLTIKAEMVVLSYTVNNQVYQYLYRRYYHITEGFEIYLFFSIYD